MRVWDIPKTRILQRVGQNQFTMKTVFVSATFALFLLVGCTKEKNDLIPTATPTPNSSSVTLTSSEQDVINQMVKLADKISAENTNKSLTLPNPNTGNPYDIYGAAHNRGLTYFGNNYNPTESNFVDLNLDGTPDQLTTEKQKLEGLMGQFIRGESGVNFPITPVSAPFGLIAPGLELDYAGAFSAIESYRGNSLPLFDKTLLRTYFESIERMNNPTAAIAYSAGVEGIINASGLLIPVNSKNALLGAVAIYKHSLVFWINEYQTNGASSHYPGIQDLANDPDSNPTNPAGLSRFWKRVIGFVIGDALGAYEILGAGGALFTGLGVGWSAAVLALMMSAAGAFGMGFT